MLLIGRWHEGTAPAGRRHPARRAGRVRAAKRCRGRRAAGRRGPLGVRDRRPTRRLPEPVREALLRLAESNIVRISRNRGFTVVHPDAREIREIFELRLMLEVPAAEQAVNARPPMLARDLAAALADLRALARGDDESSFMKRDKEFHALLLRASGNRKLAEIVGELETRPWQSAHRRQPARAASKTSRLNTLRSCRRSGPATAPLRRAPWRLT